MMDKHTEEIDKLIKETLSQEEAKFYDELDEQNLLQMLVGLLQGKNKWLILLMNFMNIVLLVLLIYSVVQFFKVETTKELLMWGIGSLMFLSAMSMLKMFAWMQMDKNAILREMKRLELLVSSLLGKTS